MNNNKSAKPAEKFTDNENFKATKHNAWMKKKAFKQAANKHHDKNWN